MMSAKMLIRSGQAIKVAKRRHNTDDGTATKTAVTVRFAGSADGIRAKFNDHKEATNAARILQGMLLAAQHDDTAYNEACELWYEMIQHVVELEQQREQEQGNEATSDVA